jgi:hypothetical protein
VPKVHEHCLFLSFALLSCRCIFLRFHNSQGGGQRFDPAQVHHVFNNLQAAFLQSRSITFQFSRLMGVNRHAGWKVT